MADKRDSLFRRVLRYARHFSNCKVYSTESMFMESIKASNDTCSCGWKDMEKEIARELNREVIG